MQDRYNGYLIVSDSQKFQSGKWSVSVFVERDEGRDGISRQRFSAEDGIEYILEIEAIHESINLGKRLIDRHQV